MIIKKQHINGALHVLIWSALLLLPYFIGDAGNGYQVGLLPGVLFTAFGVIHLLLFYTNAFYLVPSFLTKRRWPLYILFAICLTGMSFALKFCILRTWYPELLQNPSIYRFSFAPSVGILFISIVFRKVIDRIRFERKQREKEATMLMTELKFLRSQISPHFLFNVMTNLVALARKRSEQLEPALITLAEFMRYIVYDTQGQKVKLESETEHLKSYISLQRMRFGADLQIDDHIEAADGHHVIEPMLLIPFVENAFKHSAVQEAAAFIKIRLELIKNILYFEVWNSIPVQQAGTNDAHSGVGLKNVISRLELLYPGKHELKINREDNIFHVCLKLDLV
ncbi:histidine kinase [Niabella sp. 3A5MI-3]|nr:histidine kinase [Niabella beijingensis]